MSWDDTLPLFMIGTSLIPAIWIFFLKESAYRARTIINLAGALLKLLLVVVLFREVRLGREIIFEYSLMPNLTLKFRYLDPVGNGYGTFGQESGQRIDHLRTCFGVAKFHFC